MNRIVHPWSRGPGLERETGRTSWYYQRIENGSFKKLTRKQVEGFYEAQVPLTPSEDGFVRLYTVTLSMKDRKPQRILGEYATKHLARESGLIDEEHWMDSGRTTMNSVFGDFRPIDDGPATIGTQKMARRRMEEHHFWKPSADDVRELVRLLVARGVPDFNKDSRD